MSHTALAVVTPNWKSVTRIYRTDTHKVIKRTVWIDGRVIKNRTKFTRLVQQT